MTETELAEYIWRQKQKHFQRDMEVPTRPQPKQWGSEYRACCIEYGAAGDSGVAAVPTIRQQ